ncbi:cysteine and glycine-rich protein 2-like isoform X2 [Leguminivora glycinivorella]|uniref:cysteine and glycine-rich protein 2-like isoform X2 n=1 Tax=Leguminivora glycinivorella TaxID=1035111 RepID=UPI00200E91ED|nr:cysteine and glycine-rich protein 2-like isoform X2 [Leguminivora glycinivorella]
MENKSQDVPKKCFCARCFQPIDEKEKIEIDGQNFHRVCGTCCICRHIPAKLKMFYGHVFCEECFKTFVLARLRGETPQVHVDSWWMQFAPGVKAQATASEAGQQPPKPEAKPETKPDAKPEQPSECKRCVCARCLQPVDDSDKVVIGGQAFHCCCARCCSCHQVPKDNIKIYCGQVFCEACFNHHIMSRNRDNPTEFFRSCFEQWQNNPQFAEHMRMFMESSASAHAPLVFMTPPTCRVNAEREEVDSKCA